MKRGRSYRLLARSSAPVQLARSSLWLGDDHILQASHQTLDDRYRRFFFKDIHAIHVHRTWRYRLSLVFFGLLTLAILMIFAVSGSAAVRVVTAIIGLPALALLLANAVGGPSCSFWIRTALGETCLPAVTRVRIAEKILRQIDPLILAAQSDREDRASPIPESAPEPEPMSEARQEPEPVAADATALDEATSTPVVPPPLPPRAAPVAPLPLSVPPPLSAVDPVAPRSFLFGQAILCLLLMLLGLGKALLMLQSSIALTLICGAIAVAYIIGLVGLLIRQHGHKTLPAATRFNRNLALAGAGLSLLLVLQFYIFMFQRIGEPFGSKAMLHEFAFLSEHPGMAVRMVGWLTAGTSLVFGLIGLGSLVRRRTMERPRP